MDVREGFLLMNKLQKLIGKGFWANLDLPIVGLSPMDGVTDAPMRFISKKYGMPDVIYTEFISVEGLWRIKKRGETTHKIWNELKYDKSETPVVVQLFGSDPDSFYEATKIVVPMGFDGIDINMGCPSPGLEKRGGGAGLMRDTGLAHRVIEAVRKGVDEVGRNIPVSVKTRVGTNVADPSWWKFLAGEELPLVAMHGRTFKQLYSGDADWEVLKEAAKEIREAGTLFLGNGDIESAALYIDRYGDDFDGVLIGRAAIGNPWVLRKDAYEPSVEEKLKVALEHARVYEEHLPGNKFEIMRKHLTWYAHGFPGAGGLRRKLVVTNSADEVLEIIEKFLDESVN